MANFTDVYISNDSKHYRYYASYDAQYSESDILNELSEKNVQGKARFMSFKNSSVPVRSTYVIPNTEKVVYAENNYGGAEMNSEFLDLIRERFQLMDERADQRMIKIENKFNEILEAIENIDAGSDEENSGDVSEMLKSFNGMSDLTKILKPEQNNEQSEKS